MLFHEGPVLAVCPFAPRHPFEVWLVPESPGPSFADATPEEVDAVGRAMHRVYRALAAVVGDAPTTATALGAPVGEVSAGVGYAGFPDVAERGFVASYGGRGIHYTQPHGIFHGLAAKHGL